MSHFTCSGVWQNIYKLCEFFCIPKIDDGTFDVYASDLPDPECVVHWTPAAQGIRQAMLDYQDRCYREWQGQNEKSSRD